MSSLIPSISLCLGLLAFPADRLAAQHRDLPPAATDPSYPPPRLVTNTPPVQEADSSDYPDPNSVMYKSMMLPGWGQVVNRQAWKVPLVYGLLGGLAWYSVHLTRQYHDYRAAYYNLHPESPDDLKYGPTPDFIPENTSLEALKSNRNTLRNRRDLVYVGIGLAYGLNIVDAYVFAHMRSFDVSENLSMRTSLKPAMGEGRLAASAGLPTPGFTLSFELIKNRKHE